MDNIKRRSTNTVWYLNMDNVRAKVAEEKKVRGVTLADMQRETGVDMATVSNFLNGAGLATNSAVSLIKWSGRGSTVSSPAAAAHRRTSKPLPSVNCAPCSDR